MYEKLFRFYEDQPKLDAMDYILYNALVLNTSLDTPYNDPSVDELKAQVKNLSVMFSILVGLLLEKNILTQENVGQNLTDIL